MRALVKYEHGVGNMEIRDVPVPVIADDEVLVKVKCVGVCGTDLKVYDDQFVNFPPVIVGHEFGGEIVETGSAVTMYRKGDRVVSEQHFGACGKCEYCLTGKRQFCKHKLSPGYMTDGAYADFIAVKENLLHKIPDALTYEEAALLEPMGIVAQALFEKCTISPQDKVVILGCGPIAIMGLQIVRAVGAQNVVMTCMDVDEAVRRPLALSLGADDVINVQKRDAIKEITELYGGGADVVIDLAGAPAAINSGFKMLRKDGKFCAIGLPHGDIPIPWQSLVMGAYTVYFSFSSGYKTWERCLSMIAQGKIKLDAYVKAVYPLEDWYTAFEDARHGKVLKAIIKVSD